MGNHFWKENVCIFCGGEYTEKTEKDHKNCAKNTLGVHVKEEVKLDEEIS